jgi:hypothetical protein
MGAVQERSGITLEIVKARLGVSGSASDVLLEEILDAALEAADDFLNNPFTGADGAELAIPAIVKRGVHALIKVWWELENGSGLENAASSVKEGDVQINFLDASARGVAPIQTQFWASHRLEPGL